MLGERLVAILESGDAEVRDASFQATCAGASTAALLEARHALHACVERSDDLYRRVRALLFLAALYGHELAPRLPPGGNVPRARVDGRDAASAVQDLRRRDRGSALPAGLASALAHACRRAAFSLLAELVRESVRASEGNAWLFDCRRARDLPLTLIAPLRRPGCVLRERTPVRLDLSHSGWSDIFFLAMDDPTAARVLNVSIDLAPAGSGRLPAPPIEVRLRSIERPLLRLASDDLRATASLEHVAQVFDFGADELGLLRAGLVASGLVPPGLEDAGGPLSPLLARLCGPGRGLELRTRVEGVPRGSRLAVSTMLLAGILSVCMRATGQTRQATGALDDEERRRVAARAVLGEWLGGSAGGWQDSGGLWPGAKRIEGEPARPGDPEFGRSRGRLLPRHQPLPTPDALREGLSRSVLLAHGGMSGDVGPVLERVTEDYLLRRRPGFDARREAARLYDEIVRAWNAGDLRALARATDRNFRGPLRTLLPQADNPFTRRVLERLERELRADFHGFWMLGGMSGGGMGFWVEARRHEAARETLARALAESAREWAHALPFASAPVLYDFAINERGSVADWAEASPPDTPPAAPPIRADAEPDLDPWLAGPGFDRALHERWRADLLAGRIGLARNRLAPDTSIEDAQPGDWLDLRDAQAAGEDAGRDALAAGRAAVVTLAGGVASRWTRGGQGVKALYPVCEVEGHFRRFLDFHLAHTRFVAQRADARIPHFLTTSYATHEPLARHLHTLPPDRHVDLRLSPGRRFGLRMLPTLRDLAEHGADDPTLRAWVRERGEASDFREADARSCLHPLGHAWEPPNLLASGALARLLAERPALEVLLIHNVDTLGARLDPALLAWFLAQPLDLAFELVPRWFGDVGGGLARVGGRLRLVEGLALPRPEQAVALASYSSMTTWLRIDGWLASLGLTRGDLFDEARVSRAVGAWMERLPACVTLKQVQGRDAGGGERTRLVAQVEKLWGDVSALPELRCGYLRVPRVRGQQLKDPAGLDAWLRDGSAEAVVARCDWGA